MSIRHIPCHPANYRAGRSERIRYIVLHYTGNNGDSAEDNCRYFAGTALEGDKKASAHYFADENSVFQSVEDGDTAYHCGAVKYIHPICRNANSIGIEMCSRQDSDGDYYIKPETVERTAELTKSLMKRYDIPVENLLRHADVTGKECPRPWVRDGELWQSFLKDVGNMRYQNISEIPQWGRETVRELIDNGLIEGVGDDRLDLSEDMLRILVIVGRTGIFGGVEDGSI